MASALIAVSSARPAEALAPGPWRVMAHGTKAGHNVSLLVQGRWTYNDEYGPASGLIEKYPIPRRMAIVVTTTPRQRVQVHWSILCYHNREIHAETTDGTATVVGTLTLYPHLFAQRVECDPFVVAHLPGTGTVTTRILAF